MICLSDTLITMCKNLPMARNTRRSPRNDHNGGELRSSRIYLGRRTKGRIIGHPSKLRSSRICLGVKTDRRERILRYPRSPQNQFRCSSTSEKDSLINYPEFHWKKNRREVAHRRFPFFFVFTGETTRVSNCKLTRSSTQRSGYLPSGSPRTFLAIDGRTAN